MNKEMEKRAAEIVDRHIMELTLQLDNMSLTDDQYIGVVDTLSKLTTVQVMQISLKLQSKLYEDAGE